MEELCGGIDWELLLQRCDASTLHLHACEDLLVGAGTVRAVRARVS